MKQWKTTPSSLLDWSRKVRQISTRLLKMYGSQLWSERFGREPTDFLVLTLLPSVLERQQFVAFRTIILTALWCRYGGERIALAVHHVPKDLVEWLKFALFGRHATAYEVKTWCARCQSWLSAAGVDIYQNLTVSVEGSFVRETTPLATPPAVEEDRNGQCWLFT